MEHLKLLRVEWDVRRCSDACSIKAIVVYDENEIEKDESKIHICCLCLQFSASASLASSQLVCIVSIGTSG